MTQQDAGPTVPTVPTGPTWKDHKFDVLEGTVGDWVEVEWESDRYAVMWFEVNHPGNHESITVEYRWDPSQSEKPEIRKHTAVRVRGYMDDDGRLIEMLSWKDLDDHQQGAPPHEG